VSPAGAQNAPVNDQKESRSPFLARELAPARARATLRVTSEAFSPGETLDEKYTQNGENVSPPVAWSKGPSGTISYAVIVEDAGADRPEPVTHWILYDVPSSRARVAENRPKQARLDTGAMQGLNVGKTTGFLGPKPPAGETHAYHIEVFALNARLKLDPEDAERNDVVEAMKGHVLASGDLEVNYTGK